jgi:octaprenyl-diphosphate synthase
MISENAAQIQTIDHVMQAVEALIEESVNSDVDVLRDASRHILQAGGKRVRPRLLLLSYLACGGQNLRSAFPLAAAVELVHTASVVHDDINDHGVVRRGRPSVNALWGRTFALLTGDFLFTKVYELMAPYKDLNITLAEATVALVEGETLQAAAVKDNNLSRAIYHQIIARKTAALFKAAASMGAQLAGATAQYIAALEQFGFNIGLAFQIVDDILDLTGDEAQLGKTAGLDLAQGKGYASVNGNGEDPLNNIKKKLMDGNVINEARQQARQLVDAAIDAITLLPDSAARTELVDLARLVVERDF